MTTGLFRLHDHLCEMHRLADTRSTWASYETQARVRTLAREAIALLEAEAPALLKQHELYEQNDRLHDGGPA